MKTRLRVLSRHAFQYIDFPTFPRVHEPARVVFILHKWETNEAETTKGTMSIYYVWWSHCKSLIHPLHENCSHHPNAFYTSCCYLRIYWLWNPLRSTRLAPYRNKCFSGTLSFIFTFDSCSEHHWSGAKKSGRRRVHGGIATLWWKLTKRFRFCSFFRHKAHRLMLVNINSICLISSNIYHGCLPST